MSQSYKVDKIKLMSYKCKPKKVVKNIRGRYLAKSQMVRCTATAVRFEFVNFRGSHFKKVSFKNAIINGCDFWGSSFKDCSFENAVISDCVFMACKFKNCNFTGAVIKYSTVVNTSLKECKDIKLMGNVKVLNQYPKVTVDTDLLQILENLKDDKYIRKNKLLHLPGAKYNHLNLYLLQTKFSKHELPKLLLRFRDKSTRNITTYKKLELELKKMKNPV
ncbi:hypothetical protein B2I21_11020 [Chryseobacterium mucoviscidosis]|nr:hypothetical protein B2I21_11020 [Chryseobacterium mucoviscidosis]